MVRLKELEKSIVDLLPETTGKVLYTPASMACAEDVSFCFAQDSRESFLVLGAARRNALFDSFEGPDAADGMLFVKKAPLSHANAAILRRVFPWTAPVPLLRKRTTFGFGDRIGCATAHHAELFHSFDASPVFAQQSVRELSQTHRSFQRVVDDAAFQVFRAGYRAGFGADGDHLKTFDKMEEALSAGVTMLTLDLSDHLRPEFAAADESSITAAYAELPEDLRSRLAQEYTDIPALGLTFSPLERMRCALIYTRALDFSAEVAAFLSRNVAAGVDLEISIDENTAPTLPEHHYFFAAELKRRGVNFASLAPRFTGEFQKGIDYIGDTAEFARQFALHARIADFFQTYKLSIHSGSDKFSVFPAIGRLTGGRFHLKTSGTSYLEALHTIALTEPELFRAILKKSVAALPDALRLYHITVDFNTLPAPDAIPAPALKGFLDESCAAGRQLLHITSGAVLGGGEPALTKTFRAALLKHDPVYGKCLSKHFKRHFSLLGIPEKDQP